MRPQVSPDGETIVYVRRSNDIMKDRVRSNLWQIKRSGKNHRPLHSGFKNSYSPRWSPDNTRIAILVLSGDHLGEYEFLKPE